MVDAALVTGTGLRDNCGRYFYCENCGKCWRDDESLIHDIECLDCSGEAELIDYKEYLALTYN